MSNWNHPSPPRLISALIVASLVVAGLVSVAPAQSGATGGHNAVALLTVTPPPPTPTAGGGSPTSASCELTLVSDSSTVMVGDSLNFDVDVDCVCQPAGSMPPGVQCNFLLYELASVDSGGLFDPITTPIGPPGPTSVTLDAAAVGSGPVTMAWYGELVIATGNSFVYTWATLGATTDVTVIASPDTMPGDVDCSGGLTLVDARAVARRAIGALAEFTCAGTSMPDSIGDMDASGSIALVDARIVALCAIGVTC